MTDRVEVMECERDKDLPRIMILTCQSNSDFLESSVRLFAGVDPRVRVPKSADVQLSVPRHYVSRVPGIVTKIL
jgi:hypothetical protein